ncbi:hypothetical protein GGX14DRAFT_356871, partial [Mycena pura]
VPDHRLALTCLLCGSFRLHGIHRPTTRVPANVQLCRKCGTVDELPEHVFMPCGDRAGI